MVSAIAACDESVATRFAVAIADFAADGLVVLRFTGRELLNNPAACAEEVDQLLEQQIAKACRDHVAVNTK